MKKLIATLLLITMLLAIVGCGSGDSKTETTVPTQSTTEATEDVVAELPLGQFYAGYCRKIITPEAPVPLAGYGNTDRRISQTVLDDITASVIALTDEKGMTILFINTDTTRAYDNVVDPGREMISLATGLPVDQIIWGATHTHSGPDMSATSNENIVEYNQMVILRVIEGCKEALADRKPAKMYIGHVEAEGLNFVKHYQHTLADGTVQYFGDNFGSAVYDSTTTHTTQADPTMHIMQIKREGGKEIVLANWRAHPQLTGGGTKTDMSADYVGAFREALEAQYDCHFIYFQGACGNLNPKSRLQEENYTTDYKTHGAKLAEYCMEGLQNTVEVSSYDFKLTPITFTGQVNHSQDSMYYHAQEIAALWSATSDNSLCTETGKPYGIRSPYHASSIIAKYKMGETWDLNLYAISLCDEVAIVTAPNELFDTNSMWLEENSPYAHTFTFGYTNGHQLYVPSQQAFDYSCYESDVCRFAPGTGEQIQETFLAALKEFKTAE